jgi:hypothetical protein
VGRSADCVTDGSPPPVAGRKKRRREGQGITEGEVSSQTPSREVTVSQRRTMFGRSLGNTYLPILRSCVFFSPALRPTLIEADTS